MSRVIPLFRLVIVLYCSWLLKPLLFIMLSPHQPMTLWIDIRGNGHLVVVLHFILSTIMMFLYSDSKTAMCVTHRLLATCALKYILLACNTLCYPIYAACGHPRLLGNAGSTNLWQDCDTTPGLLIQECRPMLLYISELVA